MSSGAKQTASHRGQTAVLYVFATAAEPLTAADVADRMADVDASLARTYVARLYRGGFLIRRERVGATQANGTPTYEYVLRMSGVPVEGEESEDS